MWFRFVKFDEEEIQDFDNYQVEIPWYKLKNLTDSLMGKEEYWNILEMCI